MPSIKRKYIVILLLFPVLLVLWVGYRLGFFRHINEDEIPGTYVANTDWGSSSLTIARDHTFHQTVRRVGTEAINLDGKWRVTPRSGSVYGTIALLPCLAITHEDEGHEVGACYDSIQAFGFRSIEISADPDYGISFQKR
jgi:hypothetical protein